MKFALAVGLVAISSASHAQTQSLAPDSASLKAAMSHYFEVTTSRDMEALGKLWAHTPDVMLVFPSDKQPSFGWAAVQASYQKTMSYYKSWTVAPKGESHLQWFPGLVIATTPVQIQATRKSGEAASYALQVTQTFVWQDNHWLITSAHTSLLPN
jgi:ketosteroid isomerase-like protein